MSGEQGDIRGESSLLSTVGAKAGVREIPGVQIEQVAGLQVRAR